MPRLTSQEREQRDAARKAEQKASVQAKWVEKLQKTRAGMAEASCIFNEGLASKTITLRDLWLVLAVFETEEKSHAKGESFSCKSVWFDRIAPRVKGNGHGVSGFTSRTAGKIPQFLELSRNGYIWLTDTGYALVQAMREKFPGISPVNDDGKNLYLPYPVDGLGDLPPPVWRLWE